MRCGAIANSARGGPPVRDRVKLWQGALISRSVCRSVCLLVCPSVGLSVLQKLQEKLQNFTKPHKTLQKKVKQGFFLHPPPFHVTSKCKIPLFFQQR